MEWFPFTCCESREGKSFSIRLSESESNRDVATVDSTDMGSPYKKNKCGVGINFQGDKTGALVVRSLVPEGILFVTFTNQTSELVPI